MARYLYYQGGYKATDAIGSSGPFGPGGPAGTFFSWDISDPVETSRYQTGSNTIINAQEGPDLYYNGAPDQQYPVNGKPAGAAYCTDTNVMPNGPIVGDPFDARNGIAKAALQAGPEDEEIRRYTMGWVDLDSVGTSNSANDFREINDGFYDRAGNTKDISIHTPFSLQSHWTLIVPGSVQYSKSTLDFTTIVYHIPSQAKGLPLYLQNLHVTGDTLGLNIFDIVPQLLPTPTELEIYVVPKLLFMGYGLFLGDRDGNNQFGDALGVGPLGWSVGGG